MMTEKSNSKTRNRLFQPTILFSAAMMTTSISILSPRYLVAAFTGLPIKTMPVMTTHRGQASHPDIRQFTMGTIFSSPSLLPSQNFRNGNHISLTRSLHSDKSSLSTSSSWRRHHFFHYCSSTATALNSIRGGSIDGASSDGDDGTTSSTQTQYNSSPKNLNILSLPHSIRERNDDVHAALLAVVAACRVTRSLQPDGTLFGNDNNNINDNINNNNITTLSKQDDSPVTIGDFASQAVALQILNTFFPQDVYLAEEGSEALRAEERLLDKVWEAVHGVCDGSWVLGRRDRGGKDAVWGGKEGLLEAIDFGRGLGGISNDGTKTKPRRVWALDPIDGTKGFLRGRLSGGQYCVALALIEDGVPMLSVLGCPNLPTKHNHNSGHDNASNSNANGKAPYGAWTEEEAQESEKAKMKSTSTTIGSKKQIFLGNRGCLFLAVRGCGCYEIPLHLLERYILDEDSTSDSASDCHGNNNPPWTRLYVTPNNSDETITTNINSDTNTKESPSQATFCLGVERSFSDPKGTILQIAKRIHGPDGVVTGEDGIPDIVNSLRMDGQVKYGLLARGEAQYFLRLPKEGYVDWIWDVAAGYGVLMEAGGRMTDVLGEEINFSEIGVEGKAKLPESVRGIFGSCGGGVFHDALVDAYSEVEGGRR